jgi:MFS family permease
MFVILITKPSSVQIWISILLAAYGGALFLLSRECLNRHQSEYILISQAICGYLADRTTHRRIPFLVGLIILTTGTVLLCIGSSIGLFIAGRILQGASGAVVWIVGMAILVDTVGSENIAHYMGFVSTAMSLGILCGPLLGGVIYDAGGYYAVFGLAFGILGLDIVLRIVMVEKKVAKGYEESQSIDLEDHGSTRCPPVSQNPNEAQSAPGSEDPRKPTRKFKVPPTISMLASRRLLVALFSTIVVAIIATGFDAVSRRPIDLGLG